MMEYSLRSAEPIDQAWLEKLRREVYRELFNLTWGGWDEQRHQRHFSEFCKDGNIQVIEVHDTLVGVLQIFETEHALNMGEIQISPAYQGQGLGTQVLKDIIRSAKNTSKNVKLATGLKNAKALKLYKRLGFEETHRSETHIHMQYVVGG